MSDPGGPPIAEGELGVPDRPRLLLVEDSHTDASIVRESLRRAGMPAPVVVGSGEQGLRTLAEHDFDLLLLDLRLPGMSGLEVLEALQADCPHLPVIVITGHGDERRAVATLRAGAEDYLPKDELMTSALPRAIRGVLLRRAAQVERQRREEAERLLHEERRDAEGLRAAARHPERRIRQDPGARERVRDLYEETLRQFAAGGQSAARQPCRKLCREAMAAAITPRALVEIHLDAVERAFASASSHGESVVAGARLVLLQVLLALLSEYYDLVCPEREEVAECDLTDLSPSS